MDLTPPTPTPLEQSNDLVAPPFPYCEINYLKICPSKNVGRFYLLHLVSQGYTLPRNISHLTAFDLCAKYYSPIMPPSWLTDKSYGLLTMGFTQWEECFHTRRLQLLFPAKERKAFHKLLNALILFTALRSQSRPNLSGFSISSDVSSDT